MADEMHESTMKWRVDIGQLKSAMVDAKRSISLASAEFKTATATMDNWSASADGLEAKLKQLNTILPQQKSILDLLTQQYELTAQHMGRDSAEAQILNLQIEKQKSIILSTESAIKKYEGNLNSLQNSETSLTTTISRQEQELSSLKREYVDVAGSYGKNSQEAQALAHRIEELSRELATNRKTASEAKEEADKLDHSIENVGETSDITTEEVHQLSEGFTVFKGVISNLATDAIRMLVSGLRSIGREVINLGKQAINSYADYEQLVGGINTLFGAGDLTLEEYAERQKKSVDEVREKYGQLIEAQEAVKNNAKKAFFTAGVSANNYMEMATTFSTSAIQNLEGDTLKASEVVDQAIVDMSDIVNKMGISMESAQNAYRGFTMGNFRMLDNLKLGYKQTQSEAERLIMDAEKLDDTFHANRLENGKLALDFTDLVQAIHIVIQDMGIAGTTAEEAEHTISGSLRMVKSAWENLIGGLADDTSDYKKLVDNFSSSAITFLGNVLPRITMTIKGIGEAFSGIATTLLPKILDELPSFVSEAVPALIDTLDTVVGYTMGAIPKIIDDGLIPIIPNVISLFATGAKKFVLVGMRIIESILHGLTVAIPLIASEIPSLISDLIEIFVDNFPDILYAIYTLAKEIIPAITSAVKDGANQFPTVFTNLIEMLATELPTFINDMMNLFVDTLPEILAVGQDICESILAGIKSALPLILEQLPFVIETISSCLTEALPLILEAGNEILLTLLNGIKELMPILEQYLPDIIDAICLVIGEYLPEILETGMRILNELIKGINDCVPSLIPAIVSVIMTIIACIIKNLPQFFKLGMALLNQFAIGISSAIGNVIQGAWAVVKGIWNVLNQLPERAEAIGKDMIKGFVDGWNNMKDWIKQKIKQWTDDFVGYFKKFLEIGSPSKLMANQIGKWIPEGIASGFTKDMPIALNEMKRSLNSAMGSLKTDVALSTKGIIDGSLSDVSADSSDYSRQQNVYFNQTINSPKAVDGMTLYRETSGLLFSAKVRLGNV